MQPLRLSVGFPLQFISGHFVSLLLERSTTDFALAIRCGRGGRCRFLHCARTGRGCGRWRSPRYAIVAGVHIWGWDVASGVRFGLVPDAQICRGAGDLLSKMALACAYFGMEGGDSVRLFAYFAFLHSKDIFNNNKLFLFYDFSFFFFFFIHFSFLMDPHTILLLFLVPA